MIRLLLVDDHAIFRSGLKRMLADEMDIKVCGEANSSSDALKFLRQNSVDVVMLDINMPGSSGLDVLRVIRKAWPSLPVLMLSMYREKLYAKHSLQLGAQGYVTKDCAPEDMLQALRIVAGGGRCFSGILDERDIESPMEAPAHAKLSSREFEVFSSIVRGVPLTQIGIAMGVSVKTIATHRSRVLEKLGLDSNAAMVSYALCHQLEFNERK
ncbi:MAG: response regulator transcription factor [Rhodoferax sp.]|nr:response regulator transcription factor [Rhodoferax sp.]MCF8210422.1 response regulator transcription factor [Rhodoferax sp.]